MGYAKTELYFLERDVIKEFGEETGRDIFNRASKLYGELVVTTDYKNSATYERQLRGLVYPVIAYYKILVGQGYKKTDALAYVKKETEKAAKACAETLNSQMRKLFPFRAFKRNIKKFIEYKFPAIGWSCSDLKRQGDTVSFNVRSCLYCTVSKKFGCPELCEVFCDYESKAFGKGLESQMAFSRDGMIATGYEFCDFSFTKKSAVKRPETQNC